MVQPLVRNGRILPNEEQPNAYLLSYADALAEQISRRVSERDLSNAHLGSAVNVHLNVLRDVLHILEQREGWRESGDGGYK